MSIVRPETWYILFWMLMGLLYLGLQGVVTYYVVYWAVSRAMGGR